jgi:hypothetical protein
MYLYAKPAPRCPCQERLHIQRGSSWHIPHIYIDDLVVSKIFSCELRPDAASSLNNAPGPFSLLVERTRASGAMRLAKQQVDVVEPGLSDVVRQTNKDEAL